MLLATDWTQVLIYGVPAYIAALGAAAASIIGTLNRRSLRTPSGKTIGAVAEYAHDTAIANNLLLSKSNGPTRAAVPAELSAEGQTPPQVPNETP